MNPLLAAPQHLRQNAAMMYHRPVQIEFNHCDPAGIVFFPRYYEMVSSVCENFYKDVGALSLRPDDGRPARRADRADGDRLPRPRPSG